MLHHRLYLNIVSPVPAVRSWVEVMRYQKDAVRIQGVVNRNSGLVVIADIIPNQVGIELPAGLGSYFPFYRHKSGDFLGQSHG